MRVSTAYSTACTTHQVLKFRMEFPSPQIQLTQLKSNPDRLTATPMHRLCRPPLWWILRPTTWDECVVNCGAIVSRCRGGVPSSACCPSKSSRFVDLRIWAVVRLTTPPRRPLQLYGTTGDWGDETDNCLVHCLPLLVLPAVAGCQLATPFIALFFVLGDTTPRVRLSFAL